jgi:hypothetical protein
MEGCGGGGSDSSSASSASEASTSNTDTSKTSAGSEAEPTAEGNSPPSNEFVGSGKNGQLAALGTVASDAERSAASRVIEASFQARATADWAAQCATLTAEVVKQVEENASVFGSKPGCVKALEAQANGAPEAARANPMEGPVVVLRTYDPKAFAFFHGTRGKDYVVPMEKEGGVWKLAALQEQEVP